MQCPYCGSNIKPDANICPVCHGDVQAGLARAQQGQAEYRAQAAQSMPDQAAYPQDAYQQDARQAYQQQAYQQQSYQQQAYQQQEAPQGYRQQAGRRDARGASGATPMNSSVPAQHQPLRSFDTDSMNKSPKWPIVLIAVLVVVIILAILLIVFQPWKSGTTTANQQLSAATSTTADSTSTGTDQSVSEPADAVAPVETPVAPTEQSVYDSLSGAYNALAGYNDSIVAVANQFNSEDVLNADLATRQAALDNALQVQSDIDRQMAEVNALDVTGTSYAESKAAVANLYNDLSNRIRVLVESLNASVQAGDNPDAASEQISQILSADNGEGGVNVYKADYDANYEGAAPAAPAD